MTDEFIVEFERVKRKQGFKPQKEQVLINNVEGLPLEKLASFLRKAVRTARSRPDITKVYVTLPNHLSQYAVEAHFSPEATYSQGFIDQQGNLRDGIDMVYIFDKQRRISAARYAEVRLGIDELIRTQPKTNHRHSLRREGYSFRKFEDGSPKKRNDRFEVARQIARVWKSGFLVNDDYPEGMGAKDARETLEDETCVWYVCEHNGKIVGIASGYIDGGSEIYDHTSRIYEIADCAVHPNHRKRGIMTELVRMHIRTAQNNNNVPYAYAAVEEEGMHRALISAGFELWGLSQGTNHLKHRTSRREEKPDIMDLPYSHNAVWFNPMAVAKPYRHR